MSELSAPEFARLDRFLRAHENRFALALIRISQIPLREEFAQRLEEFSRKHHRPFHRFELAGLKPVEVWGRIEAGLPPGAIAMLDGLDAAFHEPDGDMASLLNRQRERIAELLPGPVLLVLGERPMNRFLADAPDLADWYAASFEFESAPAQVGPKAEEATVPERSSEWIESRIALLQDQLRGKLRDRTRAVVLVELAGLYRDSIFGVPLHPGQPRPRSAPESFEAAEAALREAIDLQRRLVQQGGTGSERDLARALTALARLLEDKGHYAEAESLTQEALRIRERVLGGEHPDTLASVNNLAGLYESQGQYDEAEPMYQRVLAASERVLGPEHPDTLTSVNNLGYLYESQRRYAEAEPLYKRALATREHVLGEEHPYTLTSVNNLAVLYAKQGRFAEAAPLYQRALAARERLLGGMHPDTLASINNLAGLYSRQGRYAEAEPLFQRALIALDRVLGGGHPDTLAAVNNLAGLYQSQGRYAEAEPLYCRAVIGAEEVLGHDHPLTQLSRKSLEALRSKMSRA
jgi:tetratricopeptide (TPR) repeat protein